MTSFLRLNGIVVPVAIGSADLAQKDIGSELMDITGSPIWNRRAIKRTWSVRTTIRTAAEVLAFRDLVTGKGHVVNWESNNHYTTKGLAPSAVGADLSINSVNVKYGTYRLTLGVTSDNKISWPTFVAGAPWTVAVWVNTDDFQPWVHYVVNSAGQKWVNGVRNDSATTTFLAVSSGVLTLGLTGTAMSLDDLVAFPQVMPTDWPTQVYSFGHPFGELPKLTADGLLMEQNSVINVKGIVGEAKLISGTVQSTQAKNLHDFAFQLAEV